jgi:hypothetical protein
MPAIRTAGIVPAFKRLHFRFSPPFRTRPGLYLQCVYTVLYCESRIPQPVIQITRESKKRLTKHKHGFRRLTRKSGEDVDELFGCHVVGVRSEDQMTDYGT